MKRALVTGATGFIGYHLAKSLLAEGVAVKCLVRSPSRLAELSESGVTLVRGDLLDTSSLNEAVQGVDVVYHLAGLTKSVRRGDLMEVNGQGTRNVSEACSKLGNPPSLLLVSSLAAAGPSMGDLPRVEKDEVSPVSHYGRSKRAGELAVMDFASQVPTTIVRPPIVVGERDRDAFQWFQLIQKLGIHVTPGFSDHPYSLIHIDDLVSALMLAAERGSRLTGRADDDDGIYFAASDEVLTYAEVGQLIGKCLGRKNTRVVHVPLWMIWALGLGSELKAYLLKKPSIVSVDKSREAAAGAWACSAAKIRSETGFQPAMSLESRLRQTADWYRQQKWL